ncbi:Hsp33 family molecular chaperone HslO [Silanimonas sp.]|jgi:molecular chaperone Hsp33|uniref:Hsp33 family molecular chaperone HslO n=1 Tax=Silanimonas sp. TaxID=1929290 RepID=UPI0022C4A2A7|nr:Hsp33 family molecular chaperone HslO [Silanimonas sp.]MCZ8114375.1 Hsp33 family molecular chaperone HslO [Silanimonas sp.]
MANTDTLTRFLIEDTGVRGVLVSLDATWQEIRARAEYPDAVAHLLGEAAAAAALFCGHVKVDGRLSLQLRGTGALRTLFAECTSQGTLRGLARHEGDLPAVLGPRDFGEGSMLAITIETLPPGQREVQRYQGLVGLQEDTLSEALTAYFRQSEQLPTALLLAADGSRAAGLLLQLLPDADREGDGWARVEALFGTLGSAELLAGPDTDLLWRLFHEDGVRLLPEQPLRFACSCSQARVEDMLRGLGETEALAAAESGEAQIHCEFCGKEYRLAKDEIRALFTLETQANVSGPRGLQ